MIKKRTPTSADPLQNKVESLDGKARTCPTSSQSQARYGPRSSTVQVRAQKDLPRKWQKRLRRFAPWYRSRLRIGVVEQQRFHSTSSASLHVRQYWLLRVLFPFLMPFSSVMWFIMAHRLVAHRRSSYLHQLFVFLATVIFMFLMIRLGIYRIG